MLGRCVYLVAAILALTGLYACWCGTAMTWDGAYQFYYTLAHQQPYAYGKRFHSYVLWLPLVGLSRVTQNYLALRMAYGLPFALAPVVGLLASWWVVRRHSPGLIVWAIFGVAIAPLPGQVFLINDSIFQQHLIWPVFLGLFVPLTRPQRVVLVLLALFQLSHPVGVLLLLLTAAAGAVVAWRDPSRRRELLTRAAFLAALAALGLLKVWLWPDRQAADEFTLGAAQTRWRKGVAGAPLAGLRMLWLAALLVFVRARVDAARFPRLARWLGPAAAAAAVAGGATWLDWAGDQHRWAYALDYRRWLVPLTMPFFALCVLDVLGARRSAGAEPTDPPTAGEMPPAPPRLQASLAYVMAATFAAVLGVQSVLWNNMTARLLREAQAYPRPVVPRSALPWIEQTAMQHWGTASYLAVLQGPRPAKLILYDASQGVYLRRDPPQVPIAPWEPEGQFPPGPGPGGWFDHRPFLEQLRSPEEDGGTGR